MSKLAQHGGSNNDDLAAMTNNGAYLAGNGGDDILRGWRGNDILVGGEGNDSMFGGGGADTFRFFGLEGALSYQKPDGVETDRIFDLNFGEGDRLDFQGFGEDGANAIVRSWEQLADLVDASGWEAARQSSNNNNLVLTYDFGNGIVQNIVISNGWAAYDGAAATPALA